MNKNLEKMLRIIICVFAYLTAYTHQYSNILDLPLAPAQTNFNPKGSGKRSCKLPPYPENGRYVVVEEPNARPGDVFEDISLVQYVNTDDDQLVELKNYVCSAGRWSLKIFKYESEKMYFNTSWCRLFETSPLIGQWTVPVADRTLEENPNNLQQSNQPAVMCTLPPYPVEGRYSVMNRPNAEPGQALESAHLVYSCSNKRVLYGNRDVYCFNNVWSSKTPNCVKCGTVGGTHTSVSNGLPAKPLEITWQVALYDKNFSPFRQICGGSVVASNMVITAAHCVWSDVDKLRPASRFAVAAGKLYRPWDHQLDPQAQKSDVSEIKIPPRFRGSQTNFQDDIAVLFLSTPFIDKPEVVPLCLDFDVQFDMRQLADGNLGKVAGWGLVNEAGAQVEELQTAWFPSVDVDRCITEAAPDFRVYITSDKICAGYTNGTALCRGDSGGAIAFPEGRQEETRYYLRGIVSTARPNDRACNVYAITSFTQILAHQYFIRENLDRAVWV